MTIIQGGVKISGFVQFTPNYVPDPPTNLRAAWVYSTSGTTVTLTMTAPSYSGSGAITSYTAYSYPDSYIGTATVTPLATSATIVIANVNPSSIYQFYAYATNFAGNSQVSTASNLVLPYNFVSTASVYSTMLSIPTTATAVRAALTLHPTTGAAGAIITFNTGSYSAGVQQTDQGIYIDTVNSIGTPTGGAPTNWNDNGLAFTWNNGTISSASSGYDTRSIPLTGFSPNITKWYTEVVLIITSSESLSYIGLGLSSGRGYNNYAGVYFYNSVVYGLNQVSMGTLPTISNGTRYLMIAWDTVTRLVWFGVGGTWLGSPSAGTGGTSYGASTSTPQIIFGALGSAGAGTNHSGAFLKPSGFNYAVPTGFTAYVHTGVPTLGYTAVSNPDGIAVTTSTIGGINPPIYMYGLNALTNYTFQVYATNLAGNTALSTASSTVTTYISAGAQAYTAPGSYTWKKPTGVTNVSVVAVGGGGPGGYTSARNTYTYGTGGIGGSSYFWISSLVQGYGGWLGCGGGWLGDGGGYGGSALPVGYSNMFGCCGWNGASAGGGAGGYSGAGGAGGKSNSGEGGAGAGGGGGGGSWSIWGNAGGGGVGIYGQGASGAGGLINIICAQNTGGFGGSGGLNGKPHGVAGISSASGGGLFGGGGGGITGAFGGNGYGTFGGGGGGLGYKNNITLCTGLTCYTVFVGAGGTNSYSSAAYGGSGAVRIVWPGQLRSFPSTFVNCFAAASTTTQFAPCSPTIGAAVANSGTRVTVAYTAPSFVGGSAITSFTAVSTPGNIKATTATASSGVIAVDGLTPSTAYTFRVYATNSYGSGPYSSASASTTTYIAAGSAIFAAPGPYTWSAPAGVTSISVVAIGGGGGSSTGSSNGTYGNDSYFVNVSTVKGGGGGAAVGFSTYAAGVGGTYTGDGGGAGGVGGVAGNSTGAGGGGGAGGYSGTGGTGGAGNCVNCLYSAVWAATGMTAGAGGAGGGGGKKTLGVSGRCSKMGGGGGVGLFGLDTNGAAGAGNTTACNHVGGGGSGGLSGQLLCANGGGLFGGGGGGTGYKATSGGGGGGLGYKNNITVQPGQSYSVYVGEGGYLSGYSNLSGLFGATGGVRIVWPGQVRQFPSNGVNEKWGNDSLTLASSYAPNAPTALSAVANSGTAVTVYWSTPYPLYLGTNVITSYTLKETTTGITKTITTASTYGNGGTVTVSNTVYDLSPLTTYSFIVYANNIYGTSAASLAVSTTTYVAAGSAVYAQPGSYTWVAPTDVTSVSVVAVGGGGGGSSNLFGSCVGGDSYFYNTGLLNALGGGISVSTGCTDKVASFGNPGSNAGAANSGGTRDNYPILKHGGTGAGGYTNAGGITGLASSGGGGGGAGCGPGPYLSGGGGGGVGLFGLGSNGTAGVNCITVGDSTGGKGGSGGTNGGCSTISGGQYYSGHGGKFGGGGGGGRAVSGGGGGSLSYLNNYTVTPGNSYNLVVGAGGAPQATSYSCTWGGKGGDGGVRIVWPGQVRRFPNTNVNQRWGNDASTFALTYLPNSPAVVTSTAIDQTSVSISWIDPLNRLVNPDASSRNQNTDLKITSYTAVSVACGKTATVSTSGSYNAVISGLTTNTSYSFYVYATNSYGNSTASNVVSTTTWYANGYAVFTTLGVNTWVVPDGVTSVSVVAVGGGGAGLSSSTLPASAPAANGGDSVFGSTALLNAGGGGGGYTANGGTQYSGAGGIATTGTAYFSGGAAVKRAGGGAGGYIAAGGAAGCGTNGAASIGGGGGGGAYSATLGIGAGGGVSIFGLGSNGAGGCLSTLPGTTNNGGGGSCGGSSCISVNGYGGGKYGGGGAGAIAGYYGGGGGGGSLAYLNNYTVTPGTNITVTVGAGGSQSLGTPITIQKGAPGVVRIVWPGQIRQFPSTRVL